jgi:steroid 5-alpha reductase family enzyme
MNVLLRYVSGVPMLEKAKKGNEAFEAYKKETPIFIPFLRP